MNRFLTFPKNTIAINLGPTGCSVSFVLLSSLMKHVIRSLITRTDMKLKVDLANKGFDIPVYQYLAQVTRNVHLPSTQGPLLVASESQMKKERPNSLNQPPQILRDNTTRNLHDRKRRIPRLRNMLNAQYMTVQFLELGTQCIRRWRLHVRGKGIATSDGC